MSFSKKQGFLTISEQEIIYLGGRKTKEEFTLQEVVRQRLSDGIIKNGILEKSGIFISILHNIKQKIKYKPASIDCVLPDDQIDYQIFNTPILSKAELQKAVQLEVKRMIDYDLDRAAYDYTPIKKSESDCSIFLVVMQKYILEQYCYALYQIFNNLRRVTVRMEAIWKLLARLCNNDAIFLEVYPDSIYLTAGNPDQIYFSRTFSSEFNRLPDIEEIINGADNFMQREFNLAPIKNIILLNNSNRDLKISRSLYSKHNWIPLEIEDQKKKLNHSVLKNYFTSNNFVSGLGMIASGS
ncbi:MAG: hypothetical protein ACQEQG_01440 [Bacillota bacterium]